MIRLLNLEPAKNEKVPIYVVNQRISNVCENCGSCFAAEQFASINCGQNVMHKVRSNPCIMRLKISYPYMDISRSIISIIGYFPVDSCNFGC